MIYRIFLGWIFFNIAASTPLRQRDAYGNIGYEYDVKHPLGISRVHVQTGSNNGKGNYHPDAQASHFHPYRVPPSYGSSHQQPLHGQYSGRGPVYMEHSFHPRPSYSGPPDRQFSTHGRNDFAYHPKHTDFSQGALEPKFFSSDKGPSGIGHGYSSPPIVQQEAIDDSFDKGYSPPIVQQISVDEPSEKIFVDRTGPINFSPVIQQEYDDDSKSPPLVQDYIEQTPEQQKPIDQILLDYPSKPEETPTISQQPLENIPSIKDVPTHSEPPLIQQTVDLTPSQNPAVKSILGHTKLPLSQQTVIDVYSPIDDVSSKKGDIVLQQTVDDQPVISQFTEDVPAKQVSIDESSIEYNPDPITQQQALGDIDENVKYPIFQDSVDPHLSQISDSSIKSFTPPESPPHRFIDQPKYHFIPVGQPYEKISHSTEVIHGPSPHYGPSSTYPHKYTKPSYQYFVKSPPVYQQVKPTYARKPYSTDLAYAKNPPLSHSVKYPPQSQEPIFLDIPQTKTPPKSHSVKLPSYPQKPLLIGPPPPPRVSHSVKHPPQTQELVVVDPPHAKTPPQPPSVKLPPQEILLIEPPPSPVLQSVKLPPQTQEVVIVDPPHIKTPPSSVKVPPQQTLLTDPPLPPVHHSLKLPPQTQEVVIVDPPHIKTHPKPPSIKLPPQETLVIGPPPPPVSQSVKLPPQTQEVVILDPPHTKTPPKPLSIKLPPQVAVAPPPPVTHSVKLPPSPVSHSVKLPPPPVTHSIKLPPPVTHSVKVPPPPSTSHSVKVPPPPSHSVKVPPPPSHSVKLPPQTQEVLILESPHTKNPPKPPSVKLPVQKTLPIDSPPPPVWHSVKPQSAIQEPSKNGYATALIDSPDARGPPVVFDDGPSEIAYPPSRDALLIDSPHGPPLIDSPHGPPLIDSPHGPPFIDSPYGPPSINSNHGLSDISSFSGSSHEKPPSRAPVSHAVLLPSVITSAAPKRPEEDKISKADIDELKKKLEPTTEEIELKKAVLEATITTTMPNLFAAVPSPHDEASITSPLNAPVSHAIRLTLPEPASAPSPVSEAFVSGPPNPASNILRNPLSHHPPSHSVRLTVPGSRSSFSRGNHAAPKLSENNLGETSKEDFPAFPVKSALEQDDPVRDKVADLSRVPFGDRLSGRSRSFHKK